MLFDRAAATASRHPHLRHRHNQNGGRLSLHDAYGTLKDRRASCEEAPAHVANVCYANCFKQLPDEPRDLKIPDAHDLVVTGLRGSWSQEVTSWAKVTNEWGETEERSFASLAHRTRFQAPLP
jgi:hypothetical protein